VEIPVENLGLFRMKDVTVGILTVYLFTARNPRLLKTSGICLVITPVSTGFSDPDPAQESCLPHFCESCLRGSPEIARLEDVFPRHCLGISADGTFRSAIIFRQ
jgi:hypothetical protein